jgi:hypothetical protein
MIAATVVLAGSAAGQITSAQNVVSSTPNASVGDAQPADPAPANGQPVTVQPTTPVPHPADETETLMDPASLLPDLPPLPKAKASLVGGTIGKLDRVRDQITVQVFGGGKMKIAFDTRTHIYSNGTEASYADLRPGDRVYVDTILDGDTVFARSIRLKTSATAGDSQGVVTSFRADKGELQVRDALSPQSVKIRVTPQTRIMQGDKTASTGKLVPGTLITVKFGPRENGGEVAREVAILAEPGAQFTFVGRVVAVDLRLGLLVLMSSNDHKTYEISIDPSSAGIDENLRSSSDVTVVTTFEGNRYLARSVTVNAQ